MKCSLPASLPLQRSLMKVSKRLRGSSGVAGEPPASRGCLIANAPGAQRWVGRLQQLQAPPLLEHDKL
jgi:hypothetical protein